MVCALDANPYCYSDRSLLPPSWRKTSSLVRAETSEEVMAHALRARELDDLVKKLTTLKEDKVSRLLAVCELLRPN